MKSTLSKSASHETIAQAKLDSLSARINEFVNRKLAAKESDSPGKAEPPAEKSAAPRNKVQDRYLSRSIGRLESLTLPTTLHPGVMGT